ncbi:MAG: Gfo/Idh/MocA family oxidoreductase [Planctomycetaceae bacterium]|nr:Gfo/Idh/MocA family oxidoreductase [Planctomycetaceae bacterium]
MLRLGIAGVGGLGQLHLKNYLQLADLVRVEALADPIEDRRTPGKLGMSAVNFDAGAAAVEVATNIRSYDDYSGLCRDKDIDVIAIATPSDLHAAAAVMALENGKHVFTEKPMALNEADCRRMLDAAAASGKKLMVGQVLRFWPTYVEAARLIKSGTYGKPLSAVFRRYGGNPGRWFAEEARSGGVPLDLHIHDADTALAWFGRPDEVTATVRGDLNPIHVIVSHWRYDNGPACIFEARWDVGTPFNFECCVTMEKATLRFGANIEGGLQVIQAGKVETLPVDTGWGFLPEDRYFLQCIRDNKPVDRCPPEESMLAVKYAMAGQ